MLEFAILGLLHEAPMHGYVLRKRLHETLGTLRTFSYGSLYPTLRKLLRAGYLVEELDEADDRAWSRRGRRVYKLTAEGKERLAASKVITDEVLNKMDYYVEGVQGKIPASK